MDIGKPKGDPFELPHLVPEERPIPIQLPKPTTQPKEEPIAVPNWPVAVPVEEGIVVR